MATAKKATKATAKKVTPAAKPAEKKTTTAAKKPAAAAKKTTAAAKPAVEKKTTAAAKTTTKASKSMLTDIMSSVLSNSSLNSVTGKTGVDSSDVAGILASALPSLLNGANDQASSASTAESFYEAVNSHAAKDPEDVDTDEGAKIVSHLLGKKENTVMKEISKKTGVSTKNVALVLAAAAPIIMNLLGKQSSSQTSSSGVASLLGSLLGGSSGSSSSTDFMTSALSSVLSGAGNSSSTSILGSLLGGGSGSSSSSMASSLLGSLLGGGSSSHSSGGGLTDLLTSLLK